MVASLPMYDFPQIREATDSIWQRTREYLLRQGIDAPRKLNRSQDSRDLWSQPNLLLSQTCGCPYRRYIHDKVHLVGTPDIDLDCPSGYYYSCLIVRAGTEYNDRCWESLAYNDDNSQSGWVAPLAHARRSGIRIEEFHQREAIGSRQRRLQAEGLQLPQLTSRHGASFACLLHSGTIFSFPHGPRRHQGFHSLHQDMSLLKGCLRHSTMPLPS